MNKKLAAAMKKVVHLLVEKVDEMFDTKIEFMVDQKIDLRFAEYLKARREEKGESSGKPKYLMQTSTSR